MANNLINTKINSAAVQESFSNKIEIPSANRLRFVHHDETFATREEAKAYVNGTQDSPMESILGTRPALYGEPMVMKYGDPANPNILLAIGSVGEGTASFSNKVFFIDFAEAEESIEEIQEELALDEAQVDELSSLVGNVINAVGLTNRGQYEPYLHNQVIKNAETLNEALNTLADYVVAQISAVNISVSSDKTVALELTESPEGKMLSADVKLYEDDSVNNIIKKSANGQYIYVDGKAKNIEYIDKYGKYSDGAYTEMTIQDALDNGIGGIAQTESNIINMKLNGLHASVDVSYDKPTNTLVFKRTNTEGEVITTSYELAQMQIAEQISYDSTTNELVIYYTTGSSEIKVLRIPLTEVFKEFTVDNTNNTVTLDYNYEDIVGSNVLQANVNVSTLNDNILENQNHALYVKGTADNIRYNANESVGSILDTLLAPSDTEGSVRNLVANAQTTLQGEVDSLQEALSQEEASRVSSENVLTQKVSELSANTNSSISSLNTSIESAVTELNHSISDLSEELEDAKDELSSSISTVNSKIDQEQAARIGGDNALDTRLSQVESDVEVLNGNALIQGSVDYKVRRGVETATVYTDGALESAKNYTDNAISEVNSSIDFIDERLTDRMDTLSSSLNDIDNRVTVAEEDIRNLKDRQVTFASTSTVEINDNAGDSSRRIDANVKISPMSFEGTSNLIKVDDDFGLFAGVNLEYDSQFNQLTFSSTGINGRKVFQLQSVSTIQSITYDNTTNELVIEYKTSDGSIHYERVNAASLFNGIIGSSADQTHNVDIEVSYDNATQKYMVKGNVEFVADHEMRIAKLEEQVAELSGRVASLESQVSDSASGMSAIWDAIHTLQQNVQLYDATEGDEGVFEFEHDAEGKTGIKFLLGNVDLGGDNSNG